MGGRREGADRNPPPLEVRRLLLLQPRWMGDVLLCTPAIREARRALPDARIDFATESSGAEVLKKNPHLSAVLVPGRGLWGRIELLRTVARRGYDAVVDFRSTGSTAQLALASGAAERIGIRGRGPRNLAYTGLVERLPLTAYAARHKLDMLGRIGISVADVADLSLDLPIEDLARERAAALWAEHRLGDAPVVAMTPASRESYKQWGAERWARVADSLSRLGARVILTGGPNESDQVAATVVAMRSRPIWGYGSTSLEELGAILERCNLWIGNDGGAKHVAAAVGLPTLSVTRWRIGRVWNDPGARAKQEFLERAPPQGCDMRCPACQHRGCLSAVEVAEVVDRLPELLGG